MEYKEAIEVLFTKLPMFQRSGPSSYKVNLDGIKIVCSMLENPEKDLKYVHVSGTNGKGTVAHMLSSILQSSGYKVGLFTSPHLVDFRERIRVNGELISERFVVDFVEEYSSKWSEPSFFELTFGMALKYFKSEQVDIVVLETGMGGRLDSTNVIPTSEVCVVTNTSLDHQRFLGETIREIAFEKAGILKHGVPVVLGKMRAEAQSVILERAMQTSSEMHYGRIPPEGLIEDASPFFVENSATACKVIDVLKNQGWEISKENIIESLNNYRKISGQRGRSELLEVTGNFGSLLLDCAHNYDGISGLIRSLEGLKLHVVFGTVGDKDPSSIMRLFPKNSTMYWCSADVPRSMDVKSLSEYGAREGLKGKVYGSVKDAVVAARLSSFEKEKEQALICGSVYVVGEATL
jgi:dihydrofolate synthase/folylpolyglutamate synthase